MSDYLAQERRHDCLDVSDLPRQRRGLQYVAPDGTARLFDLYYPSEGAPPFPLIVNVSGGGWYFGHPSSIHLGGTLHSAVRRGYAFASLACTGSAEHKFPYQIQEAKAALRHLRRHARELDIDAGFLALWSFSSGGHLSLMAALAPDDDYFDPGPHDPPTRVDAVAAMYPCCRLDMRDEDFHRIGLEPEHCHSGPRSAEGFFLGVPTEDAPALCARAAPVNHLRPDAPPLMLLHGTHDRVVPYTGTLELARRYREIAGTERLLTRFLVGAGHSDPRFKSPAMCAEVLDFFDRVRRSETPCPPERQGVDL
ncbi:MAG: alpha/beta hydrolase [Oscillospiraceae bacterium]|nr:alpha/beta hydrolase [Oscillospiraceae bacterium]